MAEDKLTQLQDDLSKGRISQKAYEKLKANLMTAEATPAPQVKDETQQEHIAPQPLSVDSGSLHADLDEIAKLLLQGKDADDYIKAAREKQVDSWRDSANAGVAAGQFLFGKCNELGLGVAEDHAEAAKWYRKAAEQGLAMGQVYLGYCYYNGQGVPQDYAEAVNWYRKAAEQGQSDAQHELGVCYYNGEGVSQDRTEAAKWLRKAAEQGNALAQFKVGGCYENGQGVCQDYAEAVNWYRKAAEHGDAAAQFALGSSYDNGQGVSQDHAEAAQWYHKAAEQGDADAATCLGMCYSSGQGVVQDDAEAVKWYRKAADQNDALAQYLLARCYLAGQGICQDPSKGVKWLHKAAKQRHDEAQYYLGMCYLDGCGVRRNVARAVKWCRRAANHGNTDAQKYMDTLASDELLPEQMALLKRQGHGKRRFGIIGFALYGIAFPLVILCHERLPAVLVLITVVLGVLLEGVAALGTVLTALMVWSSYTDALQQRTVDSHEFLLRYRKYMNINGESRWAHLNYSANYIFCFTLYWGGWRIMGGLAFVFAICLHLGFGAIVSCLSKYFSTLTAEEIEALEAGEEPQAALNGSKAREEEQADMVEDRQ